MTILHLGVLDVPYSYGEKTTGEVAQILEDKYNILTVFVEELGGADAINHAIENNVSVAIADLFSGADPDNVNSTLMAMAEISDSFKYLIDTRAFDGVIPGVPTKASGALGGGAVDHRKAKPYSKNNPERVSFYDTGLFEAAMCAWVDGDTQGVESAALARVTKALGS